MSSHLGLGAVADMYHAGTNSFYTALVTSEPRLPLATQSPIVGHDPKLDETEPYPCTMCGYVSPPYAPPRDPNGSPGSAPLVASMGDIARAVDAPSKPLVSLAASPPDFAKDADEFMRRYAEAFKALKRAMPTEPPSPAQPSERPNRSLVDSTMRWRVNSTAHKVNDAFNAARIEARDECLWLSRICSEALDENDALRVEIEKLKKKLTEKERQTPE